MPSLPWDAVEGQIAVGPNGTFNWFANGKWHKQQGIPSGVGTIPYDMVEGQIAIGSDGGFHWYVDGQWWTAPFVASTEINSPQDVVPGQIATGLDETFHWSPGGVQAEPAPPPPPPPLVAVVCSGGIPYQNPYVFDSRVGYSLDGLDWVTGTDPTERMLTAYYTGSYSDYGGGVAFNGTEWLMVSSIATLHSTDGINWTATDPPFPDREPFPGAPPYCSDLFWAPTAELWLCGMGRSAEATVLYTSPDGVNWTPRSTPFDNGWISDFEWTGSELIAVGADYNNGAQTMWSSDGVTWHESTSLPSGVVGAYAIEGVAYSDSRGLLIACVSGGPPVLIKSVDGAVWTPAYSSSSYGGSICYSPELDLFVWAAGSTFSGTIFTSSDGSTWQHWTSGDFLNTNGTSDIVWHPGLGLFLVSSGSVGIYSSSNIVSWAQYTNDNPMYAYRFATNPVVT